MIEPIITILVAAIVVLIVWRYKSIFSLPFFWAAVFSCLYIGLLQVRADSGGSSYQYAALGFGVFFLGLLAADFLFFFRRNSSKTRNRSCNVSDESPVPAPVPKPKRQRATRINLLFPILPLNVGLFVSLLFATFITIVFFGQQGVPILSSFPALAWVESTSGVVNRLMTVFGPGCYASLGLVAWAVHRQSGSRAARALMYLGLGLAILAESLLSTKGAAIMIFVWFNILLFYLNKRRDLRKTVLPLIIIVVPITAAIVGVRSMSTQGYWRAGSIFQTFYNRLTTEAAQPMDFVFKYTYRFGPMHGGAMHRELARIRDQLTGRQKTPILSEYIYDLLTDQPTSTTGLSASLTLQGTGYVEWGMAGLLLYSFIQGLVFGWMHRYLLSREAMNIATLVFWGAFLHFVIATSGSGTILIGLEGVLLDFIPAIIVLLPFCFFFLLPMGRRYDTPAGRRVSRVPQG